MVIIVFIQFKVSNFFSIRDTQTLSIVADNGSELEQNMFTTENHDQLRLLRAVGIYGANAAGKSNILNALSFMRFFIVNWSNRSQPGESIPVFPFLFDNISFSKSSEFEINFIKNQIRYQYGFALNQERVLEEWLFAYPSGKPQKWFSRVYNKNKYDWKFSTRFKKNNQVTELTRDNVLFLSTAVNFNNDQLMPVFEWFLNEHRLIDSPNDRNLPIKKMISFLEDPKIKAQILSLVNNADPSISDIQIEERSDNSEPNFPSDMPMEVRDYFKKIYKEKYKIVFIHYGKKLDLMHESEGTRKIFSFVIPWIEMLDVGGLIIVDEMDNSLHPLLSRFLIELMCNPKINKANAQLIFTTHDTTLLDNELLRRDQIWFVEKDEHHATHLYPLTEFSPRKQEAFGKAYLHGRYGAVPYIGEWKF